MRALISAALLLGGVAHAQGIGGVPNPLPISPISSSLTNCQGGTGSNVAAVGPSSTLVCAAAATRAYWRVANMAALGGPYVYCTDDGSTPSASHWTFIAYPQGYQDTTGMQAVSPAAISCIAASSTGITALALKSGAAP